MSAYYNEIDPFAAAWLRELITAGLIVDGEVDERSIELVRPDDLRGFVQCHFFAGIGGWSYALRLAGWDDARPVWTGSCPCQPFSSAGAQAGGHDPRDLWPVWFQLVKECRPPTVFGEQVEAAIGHGWLDRLCDDLEAEDYAVGACGLPGPCVGAFDIRQRLWFVADADDRGSQIGRPEDDAALRGSPCDRREVAHVSAATTQSGRSLDVMGDASDGRLDSRCLRRTSPASACEVERQLRTDDASQLGDAIVTGFQEQRGNGGISRGQAGTNTRETALGTGASVSTLDDTQSEQMGRTGQPRENFWGAADWLPCSDGKARPVEPGTFPLAHGVPARVGRLRGYGNAIKPQVAQAFIEAYMTLEPTPPCDAVGSRPTAHRTGPRA